MVLYACTIPSPVGPVRAAVEGEGRLVRLDFMDAGKRFANPRTAEEWPKEVVEDAARCGEVARQIEEYFAGSRRRFELPVAFLSGTGFQREVWGALDRIDYGETISYGELAERLGRPKAVRAVGQAVGRNPIAVVLPCHRVLGGDCSLTGFGGGLERKRALLQLEGALPATLL